MLSLMTPRGYSRVERMTIRLPEAMKGWLADRAIQNNRSMNGEVVAIFKDAKDKDKQQDKEEAEKQKA